MTKQTDIIQHELWRVKETQAVTTETRRKQSVKIRYTTVDWTRRESCWDWERLKINRCVDDCVDGRFLAIGCQDCNVYVYEAMDDCRVLRRHKNGVLKVWLVAAAFVAGNI